MGTRLYVGNLPFSASEQEVTLAKELELLAHYIEIQQIRFQDRLTVNFRIDPDARYALVPNLMLQPLVENAQNRSRAASRGRRRDRRRQPAPERAARLKRLQSKSQALDRKRDEIATAPP